MAATGVRVTPAQDMALPAMTLARLACCRMRVGLSPEGEGWAFYAASAMTRMETMRSGSRTGSPRLI